MKGVIFDFNGTMFFDEAFQTQAWSAFIRQKTGRGISDHEFQEYIYGRNSEITFPYFMQKDLTKQEIAELEEGKENIYRRLCLESRECRLADGLPRFLDELTLRGIPHTIATASALGNVRFYFETFDLQKWFSIQDVVYNDGTVRGKPEPDLYLKAADVIRVNISDCVVFEDAKLGVEAAKRAGAGKVVGVASMLDEQTLLSLGASAVIADFSDLEKLNDILRER